MSGPKFMVIKLKDLRIPILIIFIAIVLLIFFIFRGKSAAQTFSPSDTYKDGKYIAGITLSDADMDLVVEIKDGQITSVALSGLDENSSILYNDLVDSVEYVNTYVTSTQSTELPQNANISAATNLLMDALSIALSDDKNAQISSTYEKINLTGNATTTELTNDLTSDLSDDIFVDEFEEEPIVSSSDDQSAVDEGVVDETAIDETADTDADFTILGLDS